MSQLINIFLEPGKVFAELKEKPSFLLPALIVVGASMVSALAYFQTVDPEWFSNQQVQAMLAQGSSKAEIAQVQQFLPGARASGWIAAGFVPVMFAIVFSLYGLYYWLAGKIAGQAVSFKQGISLSAWSSMPMLLGALIALIAVFTSSPQSSFESMQLLNVDPLLVQLPLDHGWSSLAKGFSLLNFWVWFLAALGWKTWFRTGWGQALFVVLLPSVVIYGIWAAFAAF
jgi:hypothetical protein